MDTFRREIYMAALAELRRQPQGLCSALCKSIPGVPSAFIDQDAEITPILPDWYSLAPEAYWTEAQASAMTSRYSYWWDPTMHEARIRFLEQLLSDTHGTF